MTLFHFSPDLTDVLVEISLDFFSYIWGGSFHRLKMFFFYYLKSDLKFVMTSKFSFLPRISYFYRTVRNIPGKK